MTSWSISVVVGAGWGLRLCAVVVTHLVLRLALILRRSVVAARRCLLTLVVGTSLVDLWLDRL